MREILEDFGIALVQVVFGISMAGVFFAMMQIVSV